MSVSEWVSIVYNEGEGVCMIRVSVYDEDE